MWPGDSEEVSKPGSIVSIKVVRNLLEEAGKGDGHDQPCARDTPYIASSLMILTRRYKKHTMPRGMLAPSSDHLLLLSHIAQWPCNQPSALSSWATQLPLTPWTSSVREPELTPLDHISYHRSSVQSTTFAPSGEPGHLLQKMHRKTDTAFDSRKMTNNFNASVKPLIENGGKYDGKVKVIIRQQVQPWHGSSIYVHEIALAVSSSRPRSAVELEIRSNRSDITLSLRLPVSLRKSSGNSMSLS